MRCESGSFCFLVAGGNSLALFICLRARFPLLVLRAEKLNPTQLIELAKSKGPGLRDAITASFEAKAFDGGEGLGGARPDFFFATEAGRGASTVP